MKKFALLFTVLCICLSSCVASEDVFGYQDAGGIYYGDISYLGEDFSVKITLSPMADGAREEIELEYLLPESINGYRVRRVGDSYYAVVSELEIPVTSYSLPQLSYTDALFSLEEKNITSIEADGDGNSVVKVDVGDFGAEAVAVFSSEGKLISVSLPSVDFAIKLKEEG